MLCKGAFGVLGFSVVAPACQGGLTGQGRGTPVQRGVCGSGKGARLV